MRGWQSLSAILCLPAPHVASPLSPRATPRYPPSMNPASRYNLGVLLVTLSALVWSTAGLFTRMSSSDTPTMLLWRGLAGSFAFFLYILVLERGNALNRLMNMGRHSVAYAVLGAAAMQMFIASFRFTSVAHVAVIYAIIPFAAGGLGYVFLKEKTRPRARGDGFRR